MLIPSCVLIGVIGTVLIVVMHWYLYQDKASIRTHRTFFLNGLAILSLYMMVPLYVPYLMIWNMQRTSSIAIGDSWKCKWVTNDGKEVYGTLTITEVGRYINAQTGKGGLSEEGFPDAGISGTYQFDQQRGRFSFRVIERHLYDGLFRPEGKDDIITGTTHGDLTFLRQQLQQYGQIQGRAYDDHLIFGTK
jgi:hypothetical protein